MLDFEQEDSVFNLKLQIQQLQDKVNFLAGGTDGDQLAELLMEREEECRTKERQVIELEQQLQHLTHQLDETEREAGLLKVTTSEQAAQVQHLHDRVTRLMGDREDLTTELRMAKGQTQALEAERGSLQQLLEATKSKLEGKSAVLLKREATIAALEEANRTHERNVDELTQRRKDMAARSREMKAELEQKLTNEKTRYAMLEGQLMACKREIGELKQQLYNKSRYIEENQSREKSVAQEKGRLEVKLAMLADENRQLQATIMTMAEKRKELDATTLSHINKAAKLEEENISLQRERERMRLGYENDLAKVQQHAHAKDNLWREKHRKEEVRFAEALQQRTEMCAMAAEEGQSHRAEMAKLLSKSEDRERVLATEVDQLVERVMDLEHQKQEMEVYKETELDTERRWRCTVQEEMTMLRRELTEQRKVGQEMAKLRQENESLKEKIVRQESFLRRKLMKDKGLTKETHLLETMDTMGAVNPEPAGYMPTTMTTTAVPTASPSSQNTKPLEEDVMNRRNHQPSLGVAHVSVGAVHKQGSSSMPSKPMLVREDKENVLYKAAMSGGIGKGETAVKRDSVGSAAASWQELGHHKTSTTRYAELTYMSAGGSVGAHSTRRGTPTPSSRREAAITPQAPQVTRSSTPTTTRGQYATSGSNVSRASPTARVRPLQIQTSSTPRGGAATGRAPSPRSWR